MGAQRKTLLSTTATIAAGLAAPDPRLVRADAEEEKSEKKDDGETGSKARTALETAIADMVKTCDALKDSVEGVHKRMDAMEAERKDARKDAEEEEEGKKKPDAKKDGEDEEMRGKDKPVETAADKRKDSEGDKKEGAAANARRKDAEEEKSEKHDDAELVALRSQLAGMSAQLAKLTEVADFVQRPRPDAEAKALADAQARADDVYSALGKRAPTPFASEDANAYKRRVARDLKPLSQRFKDSEIHAIADAVAFDHTLDGIYADALEHARSPASVPEGSLMAVTKSRGGHEITDYAGSSRSWMLPMSGPAQGVTDIIQA